jgi:hypothetical protein
MTTSGRKTKSRLANPALCDSTEYNLLTFWQEIVTYASVNIFGRHVDKKSQYVLWIY